jgi:hypothetical protein
MRSISHKGTPSKNSRPEPDLSLRTPNFLKFKQYEQSQYNEELSYNLTALPAVITEINTMKLRLAADGITVKQPNGIITCLSSIEHPKPLELN